MLIGLECHLLFGLQNHPFYPKGHDQLRNDFHKHIDLVGQTMAYFSAFCTESLNSCLFRTRSCSSRGIALSQELAPLSLACFIKRSRSGGRNASILNLVVPVLSDCWFLFRFSTDCSLVTMNALWVLIDFTCCLVTDFDVAYCCGASSLRFGIPIPHCAGANVTRSPNSSGSGSV